MIAQLAEQRTARSQFRARRRAAPTGCVVVHTAESFLDEIGADSGAENVARYMLIRTTPGSYHDLVDSDSWIHLVDYAAEAFQDGTGSNPWALSLSFACRAADWHLMGKARRAGFMRQGAIAFAAQQAWLRDNGYPATDFTRLTRAESERRESGFISHGDRDPARRTDPGSGFPWSEFWQACRAAVAPHAPTPTVPDPLLSEEDTVAYRLHIDQTNHQWLIRDGRAIYLSQEDREVLDGVKPFIPVTVQSQRQFDVTLALLVDGDRIVKADIDRVLDVITSLDGLTDDEVQRIAQATTDELARRVSR